MTRLNPTREQIEKIIPSRLRVTCRSILRYCLIWNLPEISFYFRHSPANVDHLLCQFQWLPRKRLLKLLQRKQKYKRREDEEEKKRVKSKTESKTHVSLSVTGLFKQNIDSQLSFSFPIAGYIFTYESKLIFKSINYLSIIVI